MLCGTSKKEIRRGVRELRHNNDLVVVGAEGQGGSRCRGGGKGYYYYSLPLPPSPPLLIFPPLPTLQRSHRLRFPPLSLYDEILNDCGPSFEFSSFFSELF
jgi:hypothetical protein